MSEDGAVRGLVQVPHAPALLTPDSIELIRTAVPTRAWTRGHAQEHPQPSTGYRARAIAGLSAEKGSCPPASRSPATHSPPGRPSARCFGALRLASRSVSGRTADRRA